MSNRDNSLIFVDLVPPGFANPIPKEDPDAVPQLTAEEIQAVIDKAYAEGHDSGFKDGYSKGKLLAQSENADEKLALAALMSQFGASISEKNVTICDDVLTLSLAIAKSMIRSEIKINPNVIKVTIGEATRQFIDASELKLTVHPDDAIIVRQYLHDVLSKKQWQLLESADIDRGGCLVETANNSIDATNEVRWKFISESLGKNLDWHEEVK
jgi:flagellar assembly protein FliH